MIAGIVHEYDLKFNMCTKLNLWLMTPNTRERGRENNVMWRSNRSEKRLLWLLYTYLKTNYKKSPNRILIKIDMFCFSLSTKQLHAPFRCNCAMVHEDKLPPFNTGLNTGRICIIYGNMYDTALLQFSHLQQDKIQPTIGTSPAHLGGYLSLPKS